LDSNNRAKNALWAASCRATQLETTLPRAAAEILLPAARRGVVSLQRMQDGFFIRRQLGTDDVQLPEGETRSLALEDATARYLKVLRDATHGHGGKGKAALETAALLAHHNGEDPMTSASWRTSTCSTCCLTPTGCADACTTEAGEWTRFDLR
jgi:hypothetical protein